MSENLKLLRTIESALLAEKHDPTTASTLGKLLLDFGSATEDNVSALKNVGFETFPPDEVRSREVSGFALRKSGILLSDLANWIETVPLPAEIRKKYPNLTQEEWDSATRVITLLLTALER